MKTVISQAVVDFITLHVDSVEELEVLLVLAESAPRAMNVGDIDARIRSRPDSIRKRIDRLCGYGFVRAGEAPETFLFRPQPAQEALARDLMTSYKTRRTEIVELIYTRSSRALASFSKAFKIKGDNDDS